MSQGLYRLTRIVCLAAAAALAQAAEMPTLGVQGLASWPTGSMRGRFSSDTGFGVGAFAEWELDAGRMLRLGYDGIWYPDDKHGAPLPDVPASAQGTEAERQYRSHALTAQYLYYPSGDNEGFYFKVGAGAMNCLTRVKTTLDFGGGSSAQVTVLRDTGVKLAGVAGLGYDFGRTWGVMAQYSFISVANHTLGGVQSGITCRF